jgi:hypothetical protein
MESTARLWTILDQRNTAPACRRHHQSGHHSLGIEGGATMAFNRLTRQLGPEPTAEEMLQDPSLKGFEAVPTSGIPGWTGLSTEQRALYEFAFLLAQAQGQGDLPDDEDDLEDEDE